VLVSKQHSGQVCGVRALAKITVENITLY